MIEEDFYWSSYNTAIAIGDIDTNAHTFGPIEGWDYGVFISNSSVYTVIDSGTRVLNISRIYYESLIRSIFDYAGIDDWFFDQETYTSCENIPNMPSLYFQLDHKWIEARPQDYMEISTKYLWAYGHEHEGSYCMLLITPLDLPLHILGKPLLIDYYTMHDVDKGKIGWVPHSDSGKDDIIETEVPVDAK